MAAKSALGPRNGNTSASIIQGVSLLSIALKESQDRFAASMTHYSVRAMTTTTTTMTSRVPMVFFPGTHPADSARDVLADLLSIRNLRSPVLRASVFMPWDSPTCATRAALAIE